MNAVNAEVDSTSLKDDPLRDVRRIVTGLVLVLVVAALALAVAALWWRSNLIENSIRRDVGNAAELLSEFLDLRLAPVDAALARLVATNRRTGSPRQSPREWADSIRDGLAGSRGVSTLVVTDADGIVVHSTVLQLRDEDWSNRPILQQLREAHPNLLITAPPMRITRGDVALVPIGRALTDTHGEFVGTVIATLVADRLRDFSGSFNLGNASTAWMLLPSGEVLFQIAEATEANDTAMIEKVDLDIAGDPDTGGEWLGPLTPDGIRLFTAYRQTDTANLIVAVSVPESELNQNRNYWLAFAGLAVAIFSGLLLMVRHRILTRLADAEADLASRHS